VEKKKPGPDLGFRTSTFKTWIDKKEKTLVPIWLSGPRLSGPGHTKKKKPLVLTLGSPPKKGEKKTLVPIWVSGPRLSRLETHN
jgi:hypothetical protein